MPKPRQQGGSFLLILQNPDGIVLRKVTLREQTKQYAVSCNSCQEMPDVSEQVAVRGSKLPV